MRKPILLTILGLFLTSSFSWAAPCEYYRDALGFPHIRGASKPEVLRCFGTFHAQDRPEQLQHLRRIALGRSAEREGVDAIKRDFFMRVLDLESHAKRIFLEMDLEQKQEWGAYAEGIQKGAPKLKWKATDSILLLLLQAFDQSRKTFVQKIEEDKRKSTIQSWIAKLGNVPTDLPWDISILKEEDLKIPLLPATSSLPLHSLPSEQTGSNNWVISSSRSATSRAWLANDPHLDLKRPAFWYWAFLSWGNQEIAGASVPGVPLIASGTNLKVAWGLTNAYIDVSEIAYVPESELPARTSVRPWVWFRFLGIPVPMFFKSFEQMTSSSGLLLPLPAPEGHRVVLRWRGLELNARDFKPLSSMMEAQSTQEMENLLSRVGIPGWNFVFADQDGKIGYRAIGRAYARKQDLEWGIPTRSWAEVISLKTLSAEEMPHTSNPKRGFIVTANHRHWPKNYPWKGGRAYSAGFRGQRIEELLNQKPKLGFEDLRSTQCDTRANDAIYFAPLLLSAAPSIPEWVKTALTKWDYQATLQCEACGIFRAWMDELVQKELSLNEGFTYLLLKAGLARDELSRALNTILQLHFEANQTKPWSEFHQAFFPPFGPSQKARTDFLATPGDKHTVNLGDGEWLGSRYAHKSGASQRLIVELSNPPRIRLAFPGAPSEQDPRALDAPKSPWMKWRDCEYDDVEFPSRFEGKRLETI